MKYGYLHTGVFTCSLFLLEYYHYVHFIIFDIYFFCALDLSQEEQKLLVDIRHRKEQLIREIQVKYIYIIPVCKLQHAQCCPLFICFKKFTHPPSHTAIQDGLVRWEN